MTDRRLAAERFLQDCGLNPTPDAVTQLSGVFLECLAIICERGYDPNGRSWKRAGWRGNLYEVMKRSDRLHEKSWKAFVLDENDGRDIINYAAFYLRSFRAEPENVWGEWGDPS